VKRLFDLTADPQRIACHLGSLALGCPGLRVPGAFDGFEMAVRAIIGQQVSVKAATTLAGRFNAAFGEPTVDMPDALTHFAPTPERIASTDVDELARLGILPARARSIIALANAVATAAVTLEPSADVDQTLAKLKELPGIGDWTAQYIAMRALSWPDAFPHTDLGIFKALGDTNPRRILDAAEGWRP
jgi:AraC family transcriptional regulator of adaptative response / DNA-3-methyladenine glycosylase II